MKYKLVKMYGAELLAEEVTKLLNEDWYLYGNPFFGEGAFCQAVLFTDHHVSDYEYEDEMESLQVVPA